MMMKNKLIAAAALLAMAGAANAQMTIYGLFDVCYGKSLGADLAGDRATVHSGGDNGNSECNSTTRIGFKGTTDLGGGIKANFNLQSQGITSSGSVNDASGGWFGRQAWFGFSGSFGEVRVGRQDSVPFQVMGDFDFNGQSNGVSAGAYSGVGVFNRGRQSRAVQYISPTTGGFMAQVGLQAKDATPAPGDKDVFSIGAKYTAGPLGLGVAFQTKDNSAGKDFSSFAGSYDFGPAKVMLGYSDGGSIASGGTGKGPTFGVVAPVGGFSIGAIYAENSDSAVKIKSYELFANKEIFKNTYAYLEGGNWKTSNAALATALGKSKANGYALGVIYVF